MESQVKQYISSINSLYKGNARSKDLFYNGQYDFLLREGRLFKSEKLTKEEQSAVDSLFKRFIDSHGTPEYKQCFYNAQIALHFDCDNVFRYSEGYAMSSVGLPMAHGFLTINEKVVDLTWRNEEGEFFVGETAVEYFGVRFDTQDILQAMLDTEMAQSHIECYWNKGLLFRQKFNDDKQYYIPNI
jgi:hypothetical protein